MYHYNQQSINVATQDLLCIKLVFQLVFQVK